MDVQARIDKLLGNMPAGLDTEDRVKWLGGAELVDRPAVAEHSSCVANVSAALASAVGFDKKEVADIKTAARWHDIGKLAIPDEVLSKPGRHDPDEWAVMRMHARAGEILLGPDAPSLMREVAAFHHERYDGHGYEGMKGEDIPLAARIVNIADVHDALIKERDYKMGMPEEDALIVMTNDVDSPGFGRRAFDPFLLRRFVAMRLADPSFSPAPENRAALEDYSRSLPMDDIPGGWTVNGGWHVKATGHRVRYSVAESGNRRMGEMRGPTGDLQFSARGPTAVAEAEAARDDAPRM